jgi:CheY-like chemotaxis protein
MNQQAKLVLIVEDEPDIAEVIAELMRALDYRATVAVSGDEALALARAECPALLITELIMPQMDGRTLIARLRAEAHAAGIGHVPVLAISVSPRALAAAVGADATLGEPFNLSDLEAHVRRLVTARVDTTPVPAPAYQRP